MNALMEQLPAWLRDPTMSKIVAACVAVSAATEGISASFA